MKTSQYLLILFVIVSICFLTCKKEEEKTPGFKLLTNHTWLSDSLLADGVEAGGPGEEPSDSGRRDDVQCQIQKDQRAGGGGKDSKRTCRESRCGICKRGRLPYRP